MRSSLPTDPFGATHGGRMVGPRGLGAAASAAAPVFLALLLLSAGAWVLGVASAWGSPANATAAGSPKAEAVWKELTDAMGGQTAWDRLGCVRFDFVVEQSGKEIARFRHWWDRAHSRCRVEGPDEKGRIVTAIVDLNTRKGKSFTDGISDTDSANVANIVQNGYERWVNDTYWLMMPFKMRDPGTHLKYARSEKGAAGTAYDVLELSFDAGVGLTPKDRYWLFVNKKTHLIDRWEFVLQGRKPPPQAFTWERWTEVGPVRLSLERRMVGKGAVIRLENVAAPPSMDESVFTDAHPKG